MSLTQFLTGCRFEGVLSTKASNGTSGSLVAKTELFEIQGKNSNKIKDRRKSESVKIYC